MKILQKRTCGSCRALEVGEYGRGYCDLRYKIGYETKTLYGTWYYPLEPCPKPLTYDGYLDARSDLGFDNRPLSR